MAGRPRKPTKLHVLHGTSNTTRHKNRAAEPVITSGIGAPPDYLTGHAAAKWNEIASDAEYGQVLNASHRETLGHYCLLHQRFVEDATGERAMTASERQTYHSLAMQLGRTPAAQSKVGVPQKAPEQSPWDKVANR
jgi:phage terminase small subunit